jgi:hypothetical protein
MRIVLDRVAQTYVDRRGNTLHALDRIILTAADEEFVALLGPLRLWHVHPAEHRGRAPPAQ